MTRGPAGRIGRTLPLQLLAPLVWREWRHHPLRHAVALLAVALGVALAWSVHLINSSAQSEFSAAVRAANGQADAALRAAAFDGAGEGFDDALFERWAADPRIAVASPVVEIDTYAAAADGTRVAVKVLGIDALRAAAVAPLLLPRLADGEARLALLDPDAAFPNTAARERLGLKDGDPLPLQSGTAWQRLRTAGTVPAGGTPLVVMDIAAAQARFGREGRLSRIDLRLAAGATLDTLRRDAPPLLRVVQADEAEARVSTLSRAYRVNLTVLALVALFVGGFLVYSVLALSVAQRTPALALLGVLGMTSRERRTLVLAECAALGFVGSVVGLLLGAGMAAGALRLLSGDLGGGYFPGIRPTLQVSAAAAGVFGALGVVSALLGGWWPARQAEAIAPAQALKGLNTATGGAPPAWPGVLLMAFGAAASFAPPLFGLPLAAYAGVAALLVGGVALVPAAVHLALKQVPPPRGALSLLAVERARQQRRTATAAVAGVVASLALCTAITVMVSSFRVGVAGWLDQVLPADLYARTAASSATADQAWLPAEWPALAQQVSGIAKVQAVRSRPLSLAPGRPAVTLIARPLADPAGALPLLDPPLPRSTLAPGETAVYVTEAMATLYDARPGRAITLPLPGPQGGAVPAGEAQGRAVPARVLGVWRDYARQFGAIAIDDADYRRLTGDTRVNDLALWLAPGADLGAVQAALRALLPDPSMLEFAASGELRRLSLTIFDRSFAVTRYLQIVAIAIGLVGVAASLSAQVLARRKEFGLLAHLGLTRRQVVAVVAGEAAVWLAVGTAVGLALGLVVSLVLVFVVNPQSFHWTMPLVVPWPALAQLGAAVMAAGVATAAFSARRAASRQAVLSVKEDW